MTATQTPQRLQLGRELRSWRERRGFELSEAKDRLMCSLSKISRIETGHATVSALELDALLQMYEVPPGEADRLKALAEAARQRPQHRVPPWLRDYVSLEAEAVEIQTFQIDLIPGLLQTETYMHCVATALDPNRPQAVDRLVGIRRRRQGRLTGVQPPTLTAVVHESALRTRVGGAEVMRDQLARLLELAQLPHISVQAIPFAAGQHPAMGSTFTILRLPAPRDSRVVYIEDLWSADYVSRDEQVNAYTDVFSRLQGMALDQQRTEAMINEIMGEMR